MHRIRHGRAKIKFRNTVFCGVSELGIGTKLTFKTPSELYIYDRRVTDDL